MHASTDADSRPLRILWVTTKSPWPAHDGGRLLMDGTLRAFDPDRLRVTLVFATTDPEQSVPDRRDWPACLEDVEAVVAGYSGAVALARPVTATRHRRAEVRAVVARRLLQEPFDVVHVEQPHALENVPASAPPVLLRTQNVEQDLWRQLAATRRPPQRWVLQFEARRVARWERAALQRAQRVIAISSEDRDRFAGIIGTNGPPIDVIHPAMPKHQSAGRPLDGDPALVLFAGSSWGPNQDGARFFLEKAWPSIRAARPSCRLHLFGGDPELANRHGAVHHPSPFETVDAFGAGALVVVPVRAASGVRMKILDAWSRGLAVVTTVRGALGLGGRGRDILLPVADLDELHLAVLRLADRQVAEEQVRRGREWLQHHTEPGLVGSAFLSAYRSLGLASSRRPTLRR